jgi:hydroxyacylglutathione hydrolase
MAGFFGRVARRAAQGDVLKVGGLLARVLETPGHTLDHISYVFDEDKVLFAADTLFSIGCGRVFEGTYPMMWDSLLKLRALPDDFKLYCGHEYTAANVKFALTIEPDNPALKARAEEVTRLRAAGQPTIPTLLGDEKKANVFLRADEPSVAAAVRMKGKSAAEVFGELRERKNKS